MSVVNVSRLLGHMMDGCEQVLSLNGKQQLPLQVLLQIAGIQAPNLQGINASVMVSNQAGLLQLSPDVCTVHTQELRLGSHLCLVASRHSLDGQTCASSGQPGASQIAWASLGLGSCFLQLAQAVCDSHNLVAKCQTA